MISSYSEGVSVPSWLPGPASGHGDPAQTLGDNVTVEHDKPLATDHQIVTRDFSSAIEQGWDLEIAKQGSKQLVRLENEMAFEIERAKQEQKQLERLILEREETRREQERIERQNQEVELMRELMKARREAEALESQLRLVRMDQ